MKLRSALAIILTMAFGLGVAAGHNAQAAPRADASEIAAFFHDDLAPYGRWVDHRVYGIVWVPDSGRPDWHPYCDGRWVWTSDYGWYWDSREPYGWATYHYGRWALTPDYGWVWVPGAEWAPAWVDWRYGGGHVGWAPMPPEWGARHDGYQTSNSGIDARAWIFVSEPDFASADVGAHRAPVARNGDFLTASSRVTNYASVNGRIVNRSIEVARISAATNIKIAPVRVISANSAAHAAAGAQGAVAIYRPVVLAKPGLPAPLDLSVPADKVPIELDPDPAATAKAKLDAKHLPDERPVSGSFETSVGGTLGPAPSTRAPSAGSSGAGGGVLPGLGGGVRIGP